MMLSIEQCRKLLGEDCSLGEEEVRRLRDELYGLADITMRIFEQRQEAEKEPDDYARRDLLPRQ